MNNTILTYLKDDKNYNDLDDSTQNGGILIFDKNFYNYGDRTSDNAIYNNKKPFWSSDALETNSKIESQFALVKKSNSFGIIRKKVSDVTNLGKFTHAVFYVNDDCQDNSNGMNECHAGGITYSFETDSDHKNVSTFDFKNKEDWKIVDITKLKETLDNNNKSKGGKSTTRRRRKQNKRKRTTRR
jgi:hypothetical protein